MTKYPAFLGIGAQKVRTSWLHAMLSTHEDIWLPHVKELRYFDRRFPIRQGTTTRGRRSRRMAIANHVSARLRRFSVTKVKERLRFRRWSDLGWEFRYLFGSWDDAWYASLFKPAHPRIPGEITPAYSCLSAEAISHVHALMPEVKLIFLLRDPVERAWSHAKMDLARATGRSTATVTDAEFIQHFESYESRIHGDYPGTIGRWLTSFPEGQFLVGFYDEILSNPDQLLIRIFRFLGVSATATNVPPQVRARISPGGEAAIPAQLHRHLAGLYLDDLTILAQQFNGCPREWLGRCEAALSMGRL
ncbi:MAG: sulfotransferase [Steroidobacteraceae bacterium]